MAGLVMESRILTSTEKIYLEDCSGPTELFVEWPAYFVWIYHHSNNINNYNYNYNYNYYYSYNNWVFTS